MSISGDELVKLGQKASFFFFSERLPLNESIIKIAAEYDLNPEQVKRVCHAANQSTMIQIYQGNDDNTQEFDLAEPEEVLQKISSCPKIKSPVSGDYLKNPPYFLTTEIKVASYTKKRKPEYKILEERQLLQKEAEKLELEGNAAKQQVAECLLKCAGSMDALRAAFRQATLAGVPVEKIWAAVMAAFAGDPEKRKLAEEVMSKVVGETGQAVPGLLSRAWEGLKGLFKGAEVDSKLIADYLKDQVKDWPVQVTNDQHPIMRAVRVLLDDKEKLNKYDYLRNKIKDKLQVVYRKLDSPPEKGDTF